MNMVKSSIIVATLVAVLFGLANARHALAAGPEPAADTAATEEPVPGADQTGLNDPRRKNPPVVIKNVDYQDTGPEMGKVTVSGRGDPGAMILIYFDKKQLGQIVVAEDGTWNFESDRKLEPGQHALRADRIDSATGAVMGWARVGIARVKE